MDSATTSRRLSLPHGPRLTLRTDLFSLMHHSTVHVCFLIIDFFQLVDVHYYFIVVSDVQHSVYTFIYTLCFLAFGATQLRIKTR